MRPGGGWVEALAGWSSAAGPAARAEAGVRIARRAGAFGYGQVSRAGYEAGAGLRVEF